MILSSLLPFSSSPVLFTGLGAVALLAIAGLARDGRASIRFFGLAESESLMNFSPLGSLECTCEPTNASAPHNDRRRSCRACGCAIIERDPVRLYETHTRRDIRRITRNLERAGIDARNVSLPATITSLAGLHASADLATMAGIAS